VRRRKSVGGFCGPTILRIAIVIRKIVDWAVQRTWASTRSASHRCTEPAEHARAIWKPWELGSSLLSSWRPAAAAKSDRIREGTFLVQVAIRRPPRSRLGEVALPEALRRTTAQAPSRAPNTRTTKASWRTESSLEAARRRDKSVNSTDRRFVPRVRRWFPTSVIAANAWALLGLVCL